MFFFLAIFPDEQNYFITNSYFKGLVNLLEYLTGKTPFSNKEKPFYLFYTNFMLLFMLYFSR